MLSSDHLVESGGCATAPCCRRKTPEERAGALYEVLSPASGHEKLSRIDALIAAEESRSGRDSVARRLWFRRIAAARVLFRPAGQCFDYRGNDGLPFAGFLTA